MRRKKIIGIPGYKYEDRNFGVGLNYLQFAEIFGEAVILMPKQRVQKIDLLLLPGGLDTSPDNYGEAPGFITSNQDVYKEYFFRNKLHLYINANIPVFGICLGFQHLAVYFKSKLTQHLHSHPSSKARGLEGHGVSLVDKENIPEELKSNITQYFNVNSHHHQGVTSKNLGKELVPLYRIENKGVDKLLSGDDYLIEAFRHRTKKIFGVQWHPEEWLDEFSINVMRYLLS